MPDAALLLEALRQTLRERRITYAQIAEQLDVSLLTVKRTLNKPSIPLDRLLEVCEIAGLEPGELIARADEMQPTHTFVSAEQDELFFRYPPLLTYFQALLDGSTPAEIARRHKLSKASTDLYLSQLERVDLISRGPRQSVEVLIDPPLGFAVGSKTLRVIQADFMQSVVESVVNSEEGETPAMRRNFALLKPLRLNERQFDQMVSDFIKLVDRYSFLSEGVRGDDRPNWQLAIAASETSQVEPRPEAQIREVSADEFEG